jgi:hypothetical protein
MKIENWLSWLAFVPAFLFIKVAFPAFAQRFLLRAAAFNFAWWAIYTPAGFFVDCALLYAMRPR